ncbi:MAG: H4MPT-linked C1 transfer pathway protein [Planctomycetia bacterium]|nr:H4MPT-linked C1 transfer pathway protein [Planctomycetia bacterium]
MSRSVLGLDIGGANLKASHVNGVARTQPYELWKDPAGLAAALRTLVQGLPAHDALAVTMTGELCDCYETKRQGVLAILDAVSAVAEGQPVWVWRHDGRLAPLSEAREQPLPVAAANWLALATFVARLAPTGPALVVDVGSTTTDITPLLESVPMPQGRTDAERLRKQELLYTGVRRTPVCALLGPAGAAEFFATMLDVYLILGKLPENASDRQTADGRPATVAAAHARLARMVCADLESTTEAERRALAMRVGNRQVTLIRQALERVSENLPRPIDRLIVAGSGEFAARAALDLLPEYGSRLSSIAEVISLGEKLGPAVSEAACAHAVAVLASEAS